MVNSESWNRSVTCRAMIDDDKFRSTSAKSTCTRVACCRCSSDTDAVSLAIQVDRLASPYTCPLCPAPAV